MTQVSSRPDGRQLLQVRPLYVTSGSHISNSGSISACVECGDSRVVCSLRGPQQLVSEPRGHRGKIVCNVTYAPYAGATRKTQTARQSALTKDVDLMLEGIAEQVVCLDNIPQIQFELVFHVISSDDNGDVAALTAAMVMSLAKASIPMTDVVAASTSALMPSGVVACDPTPQELRDCTASCTAVAGTSTGEVCFAKHHGNVDVSAAFQLLDVAVSGAMLRRDEMRSALSSLQ
jgi:ribonuclease PH